MSTEAIIFSRLLDTNGDGTGQKAANLDFASATDWAGGATFYIQPEVDEVMAVNRMLVQIVDTGTLSADNYGALSALTTGIAVRVNSKRGVIMDLTDGVLIKKNGDWGRLSYDVNITGFASGEDFLHVRWTFAKSGRPVFLHGDRLERLEVVMPGEDLSGLTDHYFTAQGYYERGGG
jgi:hypothetical protein